MSDSHGSTPGHEGELLGGTRLDEERRQLMLRRHKANLDDPTTQRPASDERGPRPGPDFRGAQGRVAIVQGQVYLVGAIMITQLFLITTALYELLSGKTTQLWGIAAVSLTGFLVALLITLWPSRSVKDF